MVFALWSGAAPSTEDGRRRRPPAGRTVGVRRAALDPLEPYSAVERVTGIEPALSAWELVEWAARIGFSGALDGRLWPGAAWLRRQ